jgi:hypothetical protein
MQAEKKLCFIDLISLATMRGFFIRYFSKIQHKTFRSGQRAKPFYLLGFVLKNLELEASY